MWVRLEISGRGYAKTISVLLKKLIFANKLISVAAVGLVSDDGQLQEKIPLK